MRRAYLIVLAASLALYAVTTAPGSLWQDSGMAQVRVLRHDLSGENGLALAHPLYYLLAIAFQALPFVESAFKTNLVSVVFGAVTVANVFLLLQRVTGCRRGAVIGAAALAVAHTFWQHCALAEVYTLSTALLSAELLCAWAFVQSRRERWLVLLFLLNGLGVSNHMLASLSAACYGVWALWLVARGSARPGALVGMALAWTAGAGLYIGLIAWQVHGGMGLMAAIRSALFGKHFAPYVLNVLPGRRELLNSTLVMGLNFCTPAALLVLPGLAALRAAEHKRYAALLAALGLVHLLWAVRYRVADQYTFFIPAITLTAVVIGLGAARFLRGRSSAWTAALLATAMLPAAVYAALPSVAHRMKLNLGLNRAVPFRDEYAYFLHPWKTGYDGPARFAETVHNERADGDIVIADHTTAYPLYYARETGRWSKPIQVLTQSDKEAITELALADALSAGRLYVVSPAPDYCPKWVLEQCTFERAGILHRLVRK